MNSRRDLLRLLASTAAASSLPFAFARLSVAAPQSHSAKRFVFIILRGGMDGLNAVPAVGDPAFAEARGPLAQFSSPPLSLNSTFALNAWLPQMHAMYGRGEMAVLHAVGLPYKERSHFDAQQLLESGGTKPFELATGWLGRSLQTAGQPGMRAVALETAVPLVLRGPAGEVDTWAPSVLPEPSMDLVARLEALYRNDTALSQALARARGLRDEPGMASNPQATAAAGRAAGAGRTGTFVALAQKAAEFLQRGSQVAVLELGGWDSHAGVMAANGPIANNLRTLDAALAALREALQASDVWGKTVVLVATEFGREVAVNGTLGTDHGTGGAAFLLGGAVKGGRVISDWPGLAKKDRFEGRDLRITTDLRAVMRGVLGDHLQVPRSVLDSTALPGSSNLPRLDLLRG
jgi:uncharacterized protein (DUF1501 family)